jgi:hypothetical protein
MVFITAVTSVTEIKRYPSRLTLEAQNMTHVIPTTIGSDPRKSGDSGDIGDRHRSR